MPTERLEAGQLAPQFRVQNQSGTSISLADYRGQKVILFFYPEADTPACTEQACSFSDRLGELGAAGYTVLGISKDTVNDLAKFAKKYGLRYSLLSDADLAVHHAYGTWGEKLNYGRTYMGTLRSTFVIDEEGRITHVFYNTKAKGHLKMLRKRLRF